MWMSIFAPLLSFLRRTGSSACVTCLLFVVLLPLAGCGPANGPVGKGASGTTPTSVGGSTGLSLTSQPPASRPTVSALSPTPASSNLAPATLPPGANLPTEAQCAASVHRSSFEPRPRNYQANHRVPTAQQISSQTPWSELGQSSAAESLRKQITGNFTGTTDEILQWVACKWGVNPDLVRAEAVVESYWQQSQRGDYTSDQSLCPPGTWDGKGCYQSYGILQLKYFYFKSTWPMSRDDTAFNAEYVYGIIRACYEGWTTYLHDRTPLPGYPRYHAGDIWGCLGRWYSGNWYDQGAITYISKVKAALAEKAWLKAGF
jgi:hypothetical protein